MLARAIVAALSFVLLTNVAGAAPAKSKQNLSVTSQAKSYKAKTKKTVRGKVTKTSSAGTAKRASLSRKATPARTTASARKTVRLQVREKIVTPKPKAQVTATASPATEAVKPSSDLAAARERYLGIAEAVKPAGLPITLVDAVITRESRYNPKARGSSGEVGLMQILPSTGRALAKQHGYDHVAKMSHSELVAWLEVPENNIALGTRYLSMCHEKAKRSVPATIGCYNAGPGNMWAWNSISLTRKYVQFVNQHIASN
jgi:soluble lytic murein transglycosylase-like protein